MAERYEWFPARLLIKGSYLPNLGTVEATLRVGAFVVVQVKQGPRWSLATGEKTPPVVSTEVFHGADEVLIETRPAKWV